MVKKYCRCRCGQFAARNCRNHKCGNCCDTCWFHISTSKEYLCECKKLKSSYCFNDKCQICCEKDINWDACDYHHRHFGDYQCHQYNFYFYLGCLNKFKAKVINRCDMLEELVDMILPYMRCKICYEHTRNILTVKNEYS